MLAVVVVDVAVDGEYQFDRRCVGTSLDQLRAMAEWPVAHKLEEVFRHRGFDERVSTPSGYCDQWFRADLFRMVLRLNAN
jgi:hypothetical protein